MASTAWIDPMIPGSTPRTPASEHDGASSAGGGSGMETPVTGAVVRVEHRGLALEPEDRPVDDRDPLEQCRVVHPDSGWGNCRVPSTMTS